MLLAGRLPSPSTSCYPCPPALQSRWRRAYVPGPSGFLYLTRAGRKEGSTSRVTLRLTAANLDGVIEGLPTCRRHASELYQEHERGLVLSQLRGDARKWDGGRW